MEASAPFVFLRPAWLLAVVPAAWLWFALWRRRGALERYRGLAAPHLLAHLVVAPRDTPRLRPEHLLVPWLLLAVVALAGPSWRRAPSPFAEEQSGIVVVLRVSESMTAPDLPPSRLDRARHKLADLAALRPGGAMGLIAYDGSAHLVVPLTRDSRVAVEMAQALEPGVMPVKGDALTDALADAVEVAYRQLDASAAPGSVLIVTDGVAEPQIEPLVAAKSNRVQILAAVVDEAQVEQAGIGAAARALGADLERFSVDDSDVRAVSRRAEHIARTPGERGSARRDAGYWLIVPLLLGALWWARRGWSVRWQ